MTRRAVALVCGVVAFALAVNAAAQQQPVFRGGVEGVSVTVSVRKGNTAVTGLTSRDFELSDNGVPQRIDAFTVEALPIDVTLLLHVSKSIAGYRLEWLRSSVVETAGVLKKDDRLRLIAVQHSLREIVPFQSGGAPLALETLTASGGTSLYDALAAAMMRPSEADRRQLIVAFTTGVDTISILTRETAEAMAGLVDAVVYVVVPTGSSPAARRSALADAAPLTALVARTGGQIFPADVDRPIAGAFTQALDEFRTSYVLRYVPAGVAPGGWHNITVTVKGGPYDIHHRKGYGG